MKKICIIVPYFGNMPNYFPIWLESCKYNHSIDFLVFTDNHKTYNYPDNVKVIYMDFLEIKTKFQKLFDFEICLDAPYKLCDYKPAYGEVFSDYLKDYDFWGHCDIDLFFGNIRKFITEDILNKYDRVLTRGHFSLYRNVDEINRLYRTSIIEGCQSYKDVYSTNKSCCFDEWAGHCGNGISEIFNRLGINQYDELIYVDLKYLKYSFTIAQNSNDDVTNRIIAFKEGNVFEYAIKNGEVVKKEYMYCHFQKRNPKVKMNNIKNKFLFVPPNEFIDYIKDEYLVKDLKKMTRYTKIYTAPIKLRKNQIMNILKGKIKRLNNFYKPS